MNSRSFARLWKSAFVEIDEVWNALNVVAIGDSHLLFSLFEPRRDRIAPSELRCESVPDKQVAIVKPTPFFEAPLENFFVCAAFQHTIPKIAIMDAQKIAAHSICGMRGAKVLVIIRVQLAAGVQPNLVQHPREIHHAVRHFFWAFGITRHTQM